MDLSKQQITDFQQVVWQYYRQSGRHDLPWRLPDADATFDPYKILVSELMLQQTQVSRVIPKFNQFIELFPTVETLANSSLAAVLTNWAGLGYNRRAQYLHQAAKVITHEYAGNFPTTLEQLVTLPGVGQNTAGAILAYAFNQPVVFVETNIRTVYFYHFLASRGVVSDGEVAELVAQTLDISSPRDWYWALMDYGVYLKASGMKLNTLSKHYTKQSQFEGSSRQIRGQIIRLLAINSLSQAQLIQQIPDNRLPEILSGLLREGLISKKSNIYFLSD